RGEAVSLLGTIGTETALSHVQKMENDPSPQVREIVELILEDRS
ncbi:MAG: HEAT repeat domain-containing protein, partial [Deltaproteobacteria bacterium]|nr:HEAT repeat domain-containing protein [Deltaproteobacteria bacterium]